MVFFARLLIWHFFLESHQDFCFDISFFCTCCPIFIMVLRSLFPAVKGKGMPGLALLSMMADPSPYMITILREEEGVSRSCRR